MVLQNRWRLEGQTLSYYGLRNAPFTTQNTIKITKADARWVENPSPSSMNSLRQKLISQGIIVDKSQLTVLPKSLDAAHFCTNCPCNDFILPGVEFSAQGLCPICQNQHLFTELRAVTSQAIDLPRNPKGLYDVAVFYTGGKDSSFLLWYLGHVKKLRVLALCWEIPYASPWALESMKQAPSHLPTVSFLNLKVENQALSKFYKRLEELQGNHCACPSLAYLLFFPQLSGMNIPYLVLGNEPAQIQNLYFNGMAPKIAFSYHKNIVLPFLLGFTRILTFKKIISLGQMSYLSAVKSLIRSKPLPFVKEAPIVLAVREALNEITGLKATLRKTVAQADRRGALPSFIHMDFDQMLENGYNWLTVKSLLQKDLGWVAPPSDNKGLHTSCMLERVKEHSQWKAFLEQKTMIMPFSAIELCCAVHGGSLTRAEAIRELKESCGFSYEMPPERKLMSAFLSEDI